MGDRNGESDLRKRAPPFTEHKKDAEVIGIHRVDDVRTVVLNSIPLPTDPGLEQLVVETELITYKTSAITFGHESIGDLG